MIAFVDRRKSALFWSLLIALWLAGCGITSSYRSAGIKTIGDFSGSSDFRKAIGVLALSNTTIFTSEQATAPFMAAFLAGLEANASDAVLMVPGKADVPPFLWNPPRIANGDMDVFTLAGLARREGMNAVVSPILMDIRLRTRDTGFWLFKDVAYSIQVQTAAAIYDAATGARLTLGILTDEIDIDEDQASIIRNGLEAQVDDLVELAEEMGEALGERMGDAIQESLWLSAVVANEDGACTMPAGSEVGIQAGDRFSVLDSSVVLTGLDGQRYTVPGPKIGEITITRVAPRHAVGTPESGEPPPVGSILVPER